MVLIFSSMMLLFGSEPFYERFIFVIGSLLVFGFSVSYKITKDFNNKKLFSFFNVVLFKSKLTLEYPTYISVFSGTFSVNNEWGTVSAMGTKERHQKVVVRFFTDNRKETLYITNDYNMAVKKANELSTLLDVEVYDRTKS